MRTRLARRCLGFYIGVFTVCGLGIDPEPSCWPQALCRAHITDASVLTSPCADLQWLTCLLAHWHSTGQCQVDDKGGCAPFVHKVRCIVHMKMSAAQLPRLCDLMIKAVQAERKATRKAVQEATWVLYALASAKVMATPPGAVPQHCSTPCRGLR